MADVSMAGFEIRVWGDPDKTEDENIQLYEELRVPAMVRTFLRSVLHGTGLKPEVVFDDEYMELEDFCRDCGGYHPSKRCGGRLP